MSQDRATPRTRIVRTFADRLRDALLDLRLALLRRTFTLPATPPSPLSVGECAEDPIHCPMCDAPPSEQVELVRAEVRKTGWPGSPECRTALCKRCSLAFLSPRLSEAGYGEYYAKTYYEGAARDLVDGARVDRDIAKRIMRTLASRLTRRPGQHDRVIDIGCGTGALLAEWRHAFGGNVSGVELATSAAELARRLYGLKVLEVDINTHDLDGKYDWIFLIATLEHVLYPKPLLLRLNGMLTGHGRLIVLVPNLLGLRPTVTRKRLSKTFKVVHTLYFTPETLESMLERCGFSVEWMDSGYYSSKNQDDLIAIAQASRDNIARPADSNWETTRTLVLETIERNTGQSLAPAGKTS